MRSLPTRILAVAGVFHLVCASLVGVMAYVHWSGMIAAVWWLIGWRHQRILNYIVLPMVFPTAYCPKCGSLISLWQTWSCGAHYRGHKMRHACSFHCREGHEIGYFECPQEGCAATINLRRGGARKYQKGTIVRSKIGYGMERPPTLACRWLRWRRRDRASAIAEDDMPIGQRRGMTPPGIGYGLRSRFVRPKSSTVFVPESVYGRHVVVNGKSGMGKSTLIQSLASWMFESGMGATFIDPAGDLARDLRRLVPKHREDDIIEINVWDRHCPFQMNVLSTDDDDEALHVRDEVLGALRSISDSWGQDIEYQLGIAIDTARSLGGSLQDVYQLFTSREARRAAIGKLDSNEFIEFWMKVDASRRIQTPVLNKLRPIVSHPVLGPMLCARENNFDPDKIIENRKIVIVDTGSTSNAVNTIVGVFLISKLRAAAARQRHVAYEDRIRHFLVIDEAAEFMHRGMHLDAIFSQARKFKLSLVIANQFTAQLPEMVRRSAFTNCGVLLSFGVDREDADILAKRMSNVTPSDLMQQSVGECTARIGNSTEYLRLRPIRRSTVRRSAKDQVAVNSRSSARMAPIDSLVDRRKPENECNTRVKDWSLPMVCEGVR